jgi:hypothetical protein
MTRHLLLMTLAFVCVGLGFSSAAADDDCWRFDDPWTCEGLGYQADPNQDCGEASVCQMVDGVSTCQITFAYKRGPNFYGTYNTLVYAPWGSPFSPSTTTYIICKNMYVCNSECDFIPSTGMYKCTNWSTLPLGDFNYQLAEGECPGMP